MIRRLEFELMYLLLYAFLGDWVPEAELRALLEPGLAMRQVVHGANSVRGRPSAWFTMEKPG